MYEQILPDVYRVEVPLPNSPLKALNSYVIRAQGRSLIIDTGMNREECAGPMFSALQELDVDLNKADFFITHLHADHLGLVGRLATETSKVYFSQTEVSIMSSEVGMAAQRFQDLSEFFCLHGFPRDEFGAAIKLHPGYKYSPKRRVDFSAVKEGDRVDIGAYSFRCIETPGHSPGHMCLYEADKKILVSGDHILIDITPNITCWPELENALKSYLESLEKVYPLEVELVLPGHRRTWNDHRKRIRELQQHHENRLGEALAAIKDGARTAWDVAPRITWDIEYRSWEDFPPVQKWFAMGETIAHVNCLEAEGKIRSKAQDGRILLSPEG